jgi:hypothetical protein
MTCRWRLGWSAGVALVLVVCSLVRPTGPTAALAVAPAAQDTPIVPSEEARAVITLLDGRPVPKTWPLGFSLPLTSEKSVAGTHPRSVKWTVEPAEYDPLCPRRDKGRSIDAQTGTRPTTIRITLQVAKADTFDSVTVQVETKATENPLDPDPDTPKPPGPKPPVDESQVVPGIRKAAATYFRAYTERYDADAAKIAAANPEYNGLILSQAEAKAPLADKLASEIDTFTQTVVDPKTNRFKSSKEGSAAFTRIARSLEAGIRDAGK